MSDTGCSNDALDAHGLGPVFGLSSESPVIRSFDHPLLNFETRPG